MVLPACNNHRGCWSFNWEQPVRVKFPKKNRFMFAWRLEIYIYIISLEPKWPLFEGFNHQNRGQTGSRYICQTFVFFFFGGKLRSHFPPLTKRTRNRPASTTSRHYVKHTAAPWERHLVVFWSFCALCFLYSQETSNRKWCEKNTYSPIYIEVSHWTSTFSGLLNMEVGVDGKLAWWRTAVT